MSFRIAGVLSALFFLLLGSGQIYLSLRLPGGLGISVAEPGPGLFPLLVGGLMCAAAVLHLVQAMAEQGTDRFDPRRSSRGIVLLIGTIARIYRAAVPDRLRRFRLPDALCVALLVRDAGQVASGRCGSGGHAGFIRCVHDAAGRELPCARMVQMT